MRVDCEGCAGCCLDWRPLVDDPIADRDEPGGRIAPRESIDGAVQLVPLGREEVRSFVDAGYGDALTPRLFAAGPEDEGVAIDGIELAAIEGRPAFYLGLRTVPKPVAPFDTPRRWLRACIFLDPETLQCRIHDDELYPDTCSTYPGHNLELGVDTECERVERSFGEPGDRLVDPTPPAETTHPPFGPTAIGSRLFVHPDPSALSGVVDRIAAGDPTAADRAAFVGVAAGSSPGTTSIDETIAARYRRRALESASWISAAIDRWRQDCSGVGHREEGPDDRASIEPDAGAPDTPGW